MQTLTPRAGARSLAPLLGVALLFATACSAPIGSESTGSTSSALTPARRVRGDINGDGLGDIALIGGAMPATYGLPWGSMPVAFSNGNGTFNVTNTAIAEFATYATQGGYAVSGDFNGDGKADVALTGGYVPSSGAPWTTIPVAFSSGNGAFSVTNDLVVGLPFATYATQTALSAVVGDFDGDGLDDIALAGGPGWSTIPVAFSNGDGTFHVTNDTNALFAACAQQGARLVAADFNGDGKSDLALTGGSGWTSVPVAFSNGDGTFRVTNDPNVSFASYASQGALPVTGDFNGDGLGDIALTGGAGWASVPVAFSNGDGTFRVTNAGVEGFPIYATQAGAQVVAADFNGDKLTDLALTGGVGWSSIPVAFSSGDGTFGVTNDDVASFPGYATQVSCWLFPPTAISGSQSQHPAQFDASGVQTEILGAQAQLVEAQNALDSGEDLSSQQSTSLQNQVTSYSVLIQAMSNLQKKVEEAEQSIIQNWKQ